MISPNYTYENISMILNILYWEYSFINMHNDTFMIMVTIFKVHSHANRLWCAQIKLWRCVHPVIWRDGVSNYETMPLKTIKISFQFSIYVTLSIISCYKRCIEYVLRMNWHPTTIQLWNIDTPLYHLQYWRRNCILRTLICR